MSYLAAYGTLRGQWTQPRSLSFIRMGILEGYGMYTAGGYPVIFPEEHSKVIVETFEVTPDTLKNLDRYEGITGNPISDLYRREIVAIDKNTTVPYTAYAYIGTAAFKKRKLAKIPSGDWLLHQKETKTIIL